jgi:hypothetical protein
LLDIHKAWGRHPATEYFGLNGFVEAHPNAVFVLRTNVDMKTNAVAIKDAGYQLGKTLFIGTSTPVHAYPVVGNVVIKPNITSWSWDKTPKEQTMGIQTDPYFVEGILKSLQDLTIPSANMFIREANFASQRVDGKWYSDLAQRSGVNLKQLAPVGQISPEDIQWVDVPNGVWYSRIPYLWPVNSPGSCLINIAKFKSHSMGMTLCTKNLQGTNAVPYVKHCTRLSANYGQTPFTSHPTQPRQSRATTSVTHLQESLVGTYRANPPEGYGRKHMLPDLWTTTPSFIH